MATEKGAGTRFKPGRSGNPAGPAKSLEKARRVFARQLAHNASELCSTTLRMTLAGDSACAAAMVTLIASGFAEAPAARKTADVGPGARVIEEAAQQPTETNQ